MVVFYFEYMANPQQLNFVAAFNLDLKKFILYPFYGIRF